MTHTETVASAARRALSPQQQWADALASFEVHQHRRRLAQTTIDLRTRQVRRFAREIDRGPWAVTSDDLHVWLDELAGERLTRAKYRDSLRAFYRWACSAGRVSDDPTGENGRAKKWPVPATWADPLREFRRWLRAQGHPEATISLYMQRLARLARAHASAVPWALTLDDLIEWQSGQRWSNDTRRGYRTALRRFYSWGKETGRARKNPAKGLPVVRSVDPRPRPALDHEYQTALVRAEPREALALRLAAELGLRCGEVAQLHSRDLVGSLGGWVLTVHGKGGRIRYLPVPDPLANSIRARGAGHLFPGQIDGHLSSKHLGKLISRLLPPGVTMHALRHRFATRAYAVDRDTFAVQQLLGHASAATTQRYVQVPDVVRRRLVEAVAS